MAILNSAQQDVFAQIIGYVESGNAYDAFISAGTNSSNETAITIGCFQFYGTEAQNLLKRIQSEYPSVFTKYDTAGVADDLVNCNWSTYNLSKTSAKAKCIINIISCSQGKKVQDALFNEEMEPLMQKAQDLGVSDKQALCECGNFAWQGGTSAMERVIAKTTKPYTLDNLYAAVCTDTGTNQIGTYKDRQKYVYEHLKSDWPADSSSSSSDSSSTSSTTTESSGTDLCTTPQWTGYVTEKVIPRKWAGENYDRLTTVSTVAKGSEVGVCDTVKTDDGSEDWYYVLINGKTYGFIPASVVSKDAPSSSSSDSSSSSSSETVLCKDPQWKGKVTASALNVRTYAGTEYANIKTYPTIPKGEVVEVCDSLKANDGSTWYYIRIKSKTYGFVHSAYIQKV